VRRASDSLAEGLPIGVQIVGRPWEEDLVLQVGPRLRLVGGYQAPAEAAGFGGAVANQAAAPAVIFISRKYTNICIVRSGECGSLSFPSSCISGLVVNRDPARRGRKACLPKDVESFFTIAGSAVRTRIRPGSRQVSGWIVRRTPERQRNWYPASASGRFDQDGPVDHADWNFKPILGWIQQRRFRIALSLLPKDRVGRILEIATAAGCFSPNYPGIAKNSMGSTHTDGMRDRWRTHETRCDGAASDGGGRSASVLKESPLISRLLSAVWSL